MWYVIQVAEGRENSMLPKIKNVLSDIKNCRLFFPKYICLKHYLGEWHEELKGLFPGYIFIDTDKPKEIEKKLSVFTEFVKPVCIGGGFYPIRDEEQNLLEKMLDAQNVIGISTGIIVNGVLKVEEGPLCGFDDRVVKVDRRKKSADIKIQFLGNERRIRVGLIVRDKI